MANLSMKEQLDLAELLTNKKRKTQKETDYGGSTKTTDNSSKAGASAASAAAKAGYNAVSAAHNRSIVKSYSSFASAADYHKYLLDNMMDNEEGNAVSSALKATLEQINTEKNSSLLPTEQSYRDYLNGGKAFYNDLEALYYQQLDAERKAAHEKALSPYESLRANADFNSVVQAGMQKEQPGFDYRNQHSNLAAATGADPLTALLWYKQDVSAQSEAFEDKLANPALWAAVNAQELLAADAKYQVNEGGLNDANYLYMTDNELQLYTYLAETAGREKADEYFSVLSDELSQRRLESRYQTQAQWAQEHPWAASFLSLGTSALQPLSYVGALTEYLGTGNIDKNSDMLAPAQLTAAMREGATSNIQNDVGRWFANVGYSVADSALALFLGGGSAGMSSALMGGEAAGSSIYSSLTSGKTAEQALADGGVSMVVETLTEKLPLDNLLDAVKAGGGKVTRDGVLAYLKTLPKTMLQQAGIEATEETISEYANTVYDIIVNGENSEYNQYYVSLLLQGVPADEAEELASTEFFINRPMEAAAAGGASGLIFGAGGAGASLVNYGIQRANTPALTETEQAAAATLAGITQRQNTGSATAADEVAAKILVGEQPTETEIKQLQRAPGSVQRAFEGMTGIEVTGVDTSTLRASITAAVSQPAISQEKAQTITEAFSQMMQPGGDQSAVETIDAARTGGAPLDVTAGEDTSSTEGIAADFRDQKISSHRAAPAQRGTVSMQPVTVDHVLDQLESNSLSKAQMRSIARQINYTFSSSDKAAMAAELLDAVDMTAGMNEAFELTLPVMSEGAAADSTRKDTEETSADVKKTTGREARTLSAPEAKKTGAPRAATAQNTDADGDALSDAQVEYFKDSKVRSKKGRLLKVYHGTPSAGFTVFAPEKSKEGLFGYGSYFTPNKSKAAEYEDGGAIYECYLNITNPCSWKDPLDLNKWTRVFDYLGFDSVVYERMDSLIKALKGRGETPDNTDILSYLADFERYIPWKPRRRKVDGRFIEDIPPREWIEAMESVGWDGVDTGEEIVAFRPSQIKRTDNRNPTDSRDIRFSRRAATGRGDSTDYHDALTAQEWKRFYNALSGTESVGQRVGSNGVLLYNGDDINNSKLICYKRTSGGVRVVDVFELENYDETIHDEVRGIAEVIAEVVKHGYESRIIENVLGDYDEAYGTVLRRYDPESADYVEVASEGADSSVLQQNQGSSDRGGDSGSHRADGEGTDGVKFSRTTTPPTIARTDTITSDEAIANLKAGKYTNAQMKHFAEQLGVKLTGGNMTEKRANLAEAIRGVAWRSWGGKLNLELQLTEADVEKERAAAEKKRAAEEKAEAKRRADEEKKRIAEEKARAKDSKQFDAEIRDAARSSKGKKLKVGSETFDLVDLYKFYAALPAYRKAEAHDLIKEQRNFAGAFGHSVAFFTGDGDGAYEYGLYHDGKLYVNIERIREMKFRIIAHEIAHDIAAEDTALVTGFYNLYREYCEKHGRMDEFNARLNNVYSRYNDGLYNYRQLALVEELMCDTFAELADGDSAFYDYCLNRKPTLVQRIVEFFNRIINKLFRKNEPEAAFHAAEIRGYLLRAAAGYKNGKNIRNKLSGAVRASAADADRIIRKTEGKYLDRNDAPANEKEWMEDISGNAALRDLRGTAPRERTDYGFRDVTVGGRKQTVLVVDPQLYLTSKEHLDTLETARSMAASLGIPLGFTTGQSASMHKVDGKQRELAADYDSLLTDDGMLLINLGSNVPYTYLLSSAWCQWLRRSDPQTAAEIDRLARRVGYLMDKNTIAEKEVLNIIDGRQAGRTAKAITLSPDEVLEWIMSDEEGARAFAHENPGLIRRLLEQTGDVIMKAFGKGNTRAASLTAHLHCRMLYALSETADAAEYMMYDSPSSQIARRRGKRKKPLPDGTRLMSIKRAEDGSKYVDVDVEEFDAADGESVARTIARILHDKFNNLIDVNGQKIQVNKTTNDEWRRSVKATRLYSENPVAYSDKIKAIVNADEILAAAKQWIGEQKQHESNNDIVEYARGLVKYKVGNNGYAADVLVGTRKNGTAVLYDVVNVYEAKITEGSATTMASHNGSQRTQKSSVDESIPHSDDSVKHSLPTAAPNLISQQIHTADLRSREKKARLGKRMARLNEDGSNRIIYDAVNMTEFVRGDKALSQTYRRVIALAKALGVNVNWYTGNITRVDGKINHSVLNANGFYANGRLFINAAALDQAYTQVFGHELWHDVVKSNPGAISTLYGIYNRYMDEQGNADQLTAQLRDIGERYGLDVTKRDDAEKAFEELLADRFGEMLTDQRYVDRILMTGGNLWQKICASFRVLLSRIRKNGISVKNRLDEIEAYMTFLAATHTHSPFWTFDQYVAAQNIKNEFDMTTPVERKGDLIADHRYDAEAIAKAIMRHERSSRNLVAVHETYVDVLDRILRSGQGLISPSVSVSTPRDALYGNVSLVFGAKTIDPSDERNALYSGDAYTPTLGEAAEILRERYPDRSGSAPLVDGAFTPEEILDVMNNDLPATGGDVQPVRSLRDARDMAANRSFGAGGRFRELSPEMQRRLISARSRMEANEDARRGYELPDIEDNEYSSVWFMEGKPRRIVPLDEIKYVIVPVEASTQIDLALERAGIEMITYGRGDAGLGDYRTHREALNALDDVKFSLPTSQDTILRNPTSPERRSWLNDYSDTYGEIPEGEDVNSRGNQHIPAQIDEDTRIRRTYRTYAEAQTTPDEFVGELEREIIDGRASYTPVTNKEAMAYAERKLAEGMDEAMATWHAVTHGDTVANKKQIALGERLIMEAINSRNVKMFTQLVSEVAAEATRAGQMVQAISMVKRLSPEGQLMSFHKEVSKLNEELANRKGHPQVQPNEQLTEEYMELARQLEELRRKIAELERSARPDDERQRDHIDSLEKQAENTEQKLKDKRNDMIRDAAGQVPSTWMDKLRTWRYLAMLGNPRTHIRNVLGNAVFIPAVRLKQAIAGGIEHMAVKPGSRTQGIRASKELRDFAREDARTQLDILASGGKYNHTDEIRAQQKIYSDKNMFGRTLNKLAEMNSAALEGEDAFFLRNHYQHALSRYAAANRWTVDFLRKNPEALAKARSFAFREAQRATYRDMSAFAQLMTKTSNNLRNAKGFGKIGYALFEGALPFKKTPINIMKRGIEYSPLGIASAISKGIIMLRDNRNGVQTDYTGTEFINDLAAGLTGTMIVGLGYLLTSLGLLHGRDKDEEDELGAISGVQEYSVNVGGYSYTVDWVTPVAFPLFVGSELYDQLSSGDDTFTMDDFFDALAGISEPLFSLSMMDGIQSMMQSYSSEGAVFEAGQSAVESYLGQYAPTLGGQLARTIAPEVHTAYYRDKTDIADDFTSIIAQQAMAKIPGLYDNLPEKIDVWGRNVGAGKPWYQRAAENFLSPGYLNSVQITEADRLVQDLYASTGDAAVIPNTPAKYFTYNGERYDMAADEYVQYAKTRGQTAHDIITEFSQSSSFKALTPDEQATCVDTAYKFATAIAKSGTDSGYQIDTKWQREAYEKYLAGEITLAQAIIEYKTK